ncbi:MAG TPA: biopolymer transporter ExbD, partial [Planctomycetota bacterium]|nr:biopolymer transporter ExbD [Planctomycetota bacterium]
MRLTRQKRAGAGAELNIAAMIDVVFQLLIFFMCTSSFGTLENDLAAKATQPGPGQRARADFPPVRVNLVAGEPV